MCKGSYLVFVDKKCNCRWSDGFLVFVRVEKKFVEQKKCVWSSEFSIFILPFSLLFDVSDKYSTQIGLGWFIHLCVSLWFLIYIRKLVNWSERRWIAREQQIAIWVWFRVFGFHLSSIQTSNLFITWRHSINRG